MHFDPNTGEKIMDPGDEIQANAANAADQAQAAANTAADQAQAAANTAADQAQTAANNATEAAQAAQNNYAQFQQAQPQFQQSYGVPENTEVKKGLPIGAVIGIVAAIVVVLGGVIFFATRNLGGKISLLNLLTTAYDGCYMTEYAKDVQIKPFDDFTITCSGEVEDVEFSVAFANAASSHTRSVYATVTYSGFTADATAYIDEKNIKANVPILGDYLFLYDYSNNKNDGYIIEALDDAGVDVENFNALIAFLNDNNSTIEKFYDKSVDYAIDCIGGLDFKKTGNKETFTVNGDKLNCKEYQVVITEDILTEWIEGYQKVWEDFYKDNSDDFEAVEDLSGEDIDLDDLFDDILDEIDGMEDITISIFSKGKTTAAIRVESDDNMIEILFKGGDFLAQNFEINYDFDGEDGTILTCEGKTKGDVQTLTFESEELDYCLEYTFNKKTGELTMDVEQGGYDYYHIECTFTVSKNEVKIVYDEMEVYGQEMPFDSLEYTISTKADIKEPKGDKTDIGNMDEDELKDLAEDIMDELMDNDDLMELLEDLDMDDLFDYYM